MEIMRNLTKMYELARAASIVPVPVTVPSIRVEVGQDNPEAASWLAEHIQRRQRLNALIADYAGRKGLPYFDLFTATAEPDSLLLAEPYSNDGLHLTRAAIGCSVGYSTNSCLLLPLLVSPDSLRPG